MRGHSNEELAQACEAAAPSYTHPTVLLEAARRLRATQEVAEHLRKNNIDSPESRKWAVFKLKGREEAT